MRINEGNRYSNLSNINDTRTRAERIERIKQQIANGTYKPDPRNIAEKMLQNSDFRKSIGIDELV